MRFSAATILVILLATITLPLGIGAVLLHALPRISRAILRPIEIFSEAAGAISLTFVTIVEFTTIVHTGKSALVAMALAFEIALIIGYVLSGPTRAVRRVTSLGTSNRNIALALLVAVQSFPDSPIIAAVVANGLVLIGLGLVHVAWWRLSDRSRHRDATDSQSTFVTESTEKA
jgi:BASS family bile acid:Na+ symporter